MASSKLNGNSETGLAFGMGEPPMAALAVRSSRHILAEHAVSVACSASRYNRTKHVRVFPVVMPERKLCKVQRQVVLADVMERPDHATLQQAPEAVQVVRVDIPAHIFLLLMIDDLMRILPTQSLIAGVFISSDQRHLRADRLPDKLAHGQAIRVLDDLADHVSFSGNRAHDRDLGTAAFDMAFLVPVAVLILPAQVRFIHFHFAHQLRKALILHRRPDAMAHIPCCPVVPGANRAVDLQGTDALLAGGHQVDDLKPCPKRKVGVLEHGLGDDGEAVAVPTSAGLALAEPMERTSIQRIDLIRLAPWADHTVGPPLLKQVGLTGFFRREVGCQLGQGHGGFHGCSPLLRAA